ncbi:MAG: hypothetical protein J6Z23_03635 [Lachnospiraceae bacterium]|nr:hypothetical protein [Lachnospiraceae bacterium]
MKKRIISLVLVAVMVLSMGIGMTSCGGAKSIGLYSQQYQHNHTDNADPVSYTYKLEVYSDGTYSLNYESLWGIPVVTLVYGRDLTAYGKYTVKEQNDEEGTITYSLEMPTRMTLIAQERSSVTMVVDTDNWPKGDEAEDIKPGITYTLNARAETEVWENAADFLAAYGRTYDIVCDTTNGTMKVTVTSNEGKQIPADGAVLPVAAPEE